MINCEVLNTMLLLLCFFLVSDSRFSSGELRCIEKEREALLRFKQGLIDEYGVLSSWGSEEDKKECCLWAGITCSNGTGHVIGLRLIGWDDENTSPLRGKISSALLELNYLNHLDLSYNDFGYEEIPEFIGSMDKLLHLNFHCSNFSGVVLRQLENLTNLRTLDLGFNELAFDNLSWLSHLSSLSLLDLSGSYVGGTNSLQDILSPPSLKELYLRDCKLPSDFVYNCSSKSLSIIDLSDCGLTSSSFHWLFNISTSLCSIDLSTNDITANIPDDFGRYTFLEHLYMPYNQLTGEIPKSLGNLSHLETLDLSQNNLSETLPDLFNKLSMRSFSSIKVLKLQGNQLSASFPYNFGQLLPRLELLDLSGNEITGSVPDLRALNTSLKELHLNSNELKALPASVGQLSMLESLDVSFNSLEGTISDAHFSKLHYLKVLDLYYNSLVLNLTVDWVPPFQLKIIGLASCTNMDPRFPSWLKTQTNFYLLDLSSANISDEVPRWFWKLSPRIIYLNLSHNQISGRIPAFSSYLYAIDISFNNFSGHVPLFPPNSTILQLSNNKFMGSISSTCTVTHGFLELLDLSNNQFSGELPNCWEKKPYLFIINLANNKFHGNIPHNLGSLSQLAMLHLHDNSFSGKLPSTLKNCSRLVMIDVGGNELTGYVPAWIVTHLKSLSVLSLGHNNFYGIIPSEICYLNRIQILDLSRNSMSGGIPQCFSNLTSLVDKNGTFSSFIFDTDFYGYTFDVSIDHTLVQWKGKEIEYRKKTLGLLKLIDLSNNKLVGNIPHKFSRLRALISLNLSRNYLSGSIISNIGEMEMLECLDLSNNHLSGEIPIGLAELHFVGVLNLSNNNLSGKIPSSTQLQSFDPSIYAGNRELCGRPLTSCPGDFLNPSITDKGKRENSADEEDDIAQLFLLEFYIPIVLGFIIGFLGVGGTLVLMNSWRIAYFNFFSRIGDWSYVTATVYVAKLRRRLRTNAQV